MNNEEWTMKNEEWIMKNEEWIVNSECPTRHFDKLSDRAPKEQRPSLEAEPRTPLKHACASHFTVYPVEYEERIIPRGEPC